MAKKSTSKARENSVAANVEVGGNIGGNLIMGHGNIVNLAPDQISFRSLHQLPPAPADFTGRETELKAVLDDLSKNRGSAISGLTGMGGIGKTALGLVAAHQIINKYPDAQIFLDLKGVSKPLSLADIMRHVILSFEPTSDLREVNDDQLAAMYQSVLSENKALIFLDNSLDATQVRLLIPPSTCALIVTSRRSFALPGMDRPIRLDVLPEKKAVQLLKRLCKRIKGSANEVAKLCGYIPLALQIAGSFLAVNLDWSPEEYSKRLRTERLKLLKSEDDDPKYDLAAAIGLSYAQLTQNEQKYWRILSIFPASFRRDAALAIWEADENAAHDVLSRLYRMSLIDYDEKAERYSLHDLLSDYALSQMDAMEEQEERLKHATYYMEVMEAADHLYLEGNEKILLGLRLFDSEWDHIRSAQTWIASNVETSEQVYELAMLYPTISAYCLDLRLAPKQKIPWLEVAIFAARKLNRKDAESVHIGNIGIAYRNLGDTKKAIEFYEQALVIDREIGDRRGEANDLGNLGVAYEDLGDIKKAIQFYEQQLIIVREIGDRRGEGAALGNLGITYKNLGDTKKAIEFHERALVIDREIGDRRGEAKDLGNLGNAYADLGDTKKAIEFHERALVIDREIGDRRGEGNALGNLGIAYKNLGDTRKAIEFHEQRLVIAHEISDRRGEGAALGNLGIAYEDLGDTRKAIEFYEQRLVIAHEIGDRRGEANAGFNMAMALYGLGEKEKAIELAKQAMKIYQAIGSLHAETVHSFLKDWTTED